MSMMRTTRSHCELLSPPPPPPPPPLLLLLLLPSAVAPLPELLLLTLCT
jgi:hypothetical protein